MTRNNVIMRVPTSETYRLARYRPIRVADRSVCTSLTTVVC